MLPQLIDCIAFSHKSKSLQSLLYDYENEKGFGFVFIKDMLSKSRGVGCYQQLRRPSWQTKVADSRYYELTASSSDNSGSRGSQLEAPVPPWRSFPVDFWIPVFSAGTVIPWEKPWCGDICWLEFAFSRTWCSNSPSVLFFSLLLVTVLGGISHPQIRGLGGHLL